MKPFLTIAIGGGTEPVGQWTVADARGHASHVMGAVVVADLDAAYHRVLIGAVGIEDAKARNVIEDIAKHRDDQ